MRIVARLLELGGNSSTSYTIEYGFTGVRDTKATIHYKLRKQYKTDNIEGIKLYNNISREKVVLDSGNNHDKSKLLHQSSLRGCEL